MHVELAAVVREEGVGVGEDADDGVAHLAVDEVGERDAVRLRRLHHVEDLVLDVLELARRRLAVELDEALEGGAEEVVDLERAEDAAAVASPRMSASCSSTSKNAITRHSHSTRFNAVCGLVTEDTSRENSEISLRCKTANRSQLPAFGGTLYGRGRSLTMPVWTGTEEGP